jgi:hypothetical protein
LHNGQQQQQQQHHSNPLGFSTPHHQQYSSQLRRKAQSSYSSASMASSSSTVTVNVLNVTLVIFVQQDETETGHKTKVFFKFPSIASRNIPVFIKAFPNVPYILLYQNPMEVIVSHFHPTVKDSSSSISNVKLVYNGSTFTKSNMTAMLPLSSTPPLTIKCLTQRHSPGVSVVDVVQKYNQNQTLYIFRGIFSGQIVQVPASTYVK